MAAISIIGGGDRGAKPRARRGLVDSAAIYRTRAQYSTLAAGALVLFPSLFYLYRLFKSHALFTPPAGGEANCPSSDILSENAARHDKKSGTI